MALSLRTVRRATRVMNLASETAMVRPSCWLTASWTGRSEAAVAHVDDVVVADA